MMGTKKIVICTCPRQFVCVKTGENKIKLKNQNYSYLSLPCRFQNQPSKLPAICASKSSYDIKEMCLYGRTTSTSKHVARGKARFPIQPYLNPFSDEKHGTVEKLILVKNNKMVLIRDRNNIQCFLVQVFPMLLDTVKHPTIA